jgi:shikimate dehydrogenase
VNEYGLIGFPVTHSLSAHYFQEKYRVKYHLFALSSINHLPALFEKHPKLKGLNVTIPYKKQLIPFLDKLDPLAQAVQAVNTVRVDWKNGERELKGYNTDVIGFQESLLEALQGNRPKALILGSGGAAMAVQYVLKTNNMPFQTVSRNPNENELTYSDINADLLQEHHLIVNATPLGMSPGANSFPNIPYNEIGPRHTLYDLVYNPETTAFLQKGKKRGAKTVNGLNMLYRQADEAWRIWNQE